MTSRLRLRRCRVARALRRRTSGWGTFLTVSVAIVVYPNWYQNGSTERIPRAIGRRQCARWDAPKRVGVTTVRAPALPAQPVLGEVAEGAVGARSDVLARVGALVRGAPARDVLTAESHDS